MSMKKVAAFFVLACAVAPSIHAADNITADFSAASAKAAEIIQSRTHQEPALSIIVYGVDNDGNIDELPPTITKSGELLHDFVPGLHNVVESYSCGYNLTPDEQSQVHWSVIFSTETISNNPLPAGHTHAQDSVLNGDCKRTDKPHCLPIPHLDYKVAVNGVPVTPVLNMGQMEVDGLLGSSNFTISTSDPEYATQLENIHVSLRGPGECTKEDYRTMRVRIPDLEELAKSTDDSYILYGVTPRHLLNHYATHATITALTAVATEWHQNHPDSNVLAFNDMSLPWGGAFEIYGTWDWHSSHANHSFGVAIDAGKKCIKRSDRLALMQLFIAHGFTVHSEGSILHSENHYHVQYTPEITRLQKTPISLNSKLTFPIQDSGYVQGIDATHPPTDETFNGDGIDAPVPPLSSQNETMSDTRSADKPSGFIDCNAAINKYSATVSLVNCYDDTDLNESGDYCKCINLYRTDTKTGKRVIDRETDDTPEQCS